MRRNHITLILLLAAAISWIGLTSWRAHRKALVTQNESAEFSVAEAPVGPSAPIAPLGPVESGTLAAPTALVTPVQHLSQQIQPASISSSASSQVDLKELEFDIPDRETYRVQVNEQEKHEGAGVPPVLHEFSVRMAELMEKASQSPAFAAALFKRLEECAESERGEIIHQARTICAVNAIRLGEIHPQTLGTKAKAFRESLPARLKTRVVALGF
jgi:hypothetical protein